MDDQARYELIELIARAGTEMTDDLDRCRVTLLELCGDHPHETIALVMALEHMIPRDLATAAKGTNEVNGSVITTLSERLMADAHLDEDKAIWAVETWALALGVAPADEAVTARLKINFQELLETKMPPPAPRPAEMHEEAPSPPSAPPPLVPGESRRVRKLEKPRYPFMTMPRRGPDGEYDYDDPLAELWWSAENGDPTAMVKLGKIFLDGEIVDRDVTAAIDWFEKAAAARDGEAWFTLGMMHREGDGVPKDEYEAAYFFEKAAEAGHILSMRMVGELYKDGTLFDDEPDKTALYWQKRFEECDSALRMHNSGRQYLDLDIGP
ncbi:sel1 repeat family protein, partial [Candidatus Poribacteria bacterium]|nr:sel1 repeat family protein [Candidatus Poribacteria bacterium]